MVPVGRTIAVIWSPAGDGRCRRAQPPAPDGAPPTGVAAARAPSRRRRVVKASPLARKIAEQHGVDLAQVKTRSGRIEKADVLAYVESRKAHGRGERRAARLAAASPKARRLAAERGVDIDALRGSGPGGAVLAADSPPRRPRRPRSRRPCGAARPAAEAPGVSNVWRIMAERMTRAGRPRRTSTWCARST